MERAVYLYELDSVRNSPREVEIGQQALFEEIVKRGNRVILTFNQLTDSEAFWCVIKDEESYENVLELFSMGVLKISLYGDVRTASQYMQNAVEKCLEEDGNAFLFSGAPVLCSEKELLEKMKRALRYSDIGILKEMLEHEKKQEERKRLEYIIRFIRMILVLSTEELASNPAHTGKHRTFMEFYGKIHTLFQNKEIWNNGKGMYSEEVKEKAAGAWEILEQINSELSQKENEHAGKLLNNRTNWVNKINQQAKSDEAALAEAIVDLCYNYTVEESISGVTRHFDERNEKSFQEDFLKRLGIYWKQYRESIHNFCKGDEDVVHEYQIKMPPWDTAVRIIREEMWRGQNRRKEQERRTVYEDGCEKEQKLWNRRIILQMFIRLRTAFVYILIFCIVDYLVGCVEDELTDIFMHLQLGETMRVLWIVVCSTIVFGIVGSVAADIFHLPDILESVRNIGTGIKDSYRLMRTPGNIAYKNIKDTGRAL